MGESRVCRDQSSFPLVPEKTVSFAVVPAQDCRIVAPQSPKRVVTVSLVIESVVSKPQQSGCGLWKLELVRLWVLGQLGAASFVIRPMGVSHTRRVIPKLWGDPMGSLGQRLSGLRPLRKLEIERHSE